MSNSEAKLKKNLMISFKETLSDINTKITTEAKNFSHAHSSQMGLSKHANI